MGLSSGTKNALGWTLILVSWCLLTPLQIYVFYRFLRFRNRNEVFSRGVDMVWIQNIASFYCIISVIPIWTMHASDIITGTAIDVAKSWMYCFGTYAIPAVLIWRIWHLRYKIEESHHRLQVSWSSIIDNSTADNDWWLTHKATYGNHRFTVKYMLSYFVMAALVNSIVITMRIYGIIGLEISAVVSILAHPFHVGVLLYQWCHIPLFNDMIHLRTEIKISMIFYTSGIAIYFVVLGSTIALDTSDFVFYYVTAWAMTCTLYPQGCISAGVVLWTIVGCGDRCKHASLSRMQSVVSSTSSQINLPDLLADSDGFDSFMSFLLTSFEAECMLSFVEFLEYRSILATAFHLETRIEYDSLRLASCVPKSALVAPIRAYIAAVPSDKVVSDEVASSNDIPMPESPPDTSLPDTSSATANKLILVTKNSGGSGDSSMDENETDEVDFVEMSFDIGTVTGTRRDLTSTMGRALARRLFLKYVEMGSAYEVNISDKERKRLVELMRDEVAFKTNDDITEEVLFNLFNRCMDEMYQFLLYSFRRYTNEDSYKKWYSIRHPKTSNADLLRSTSHL